MILKAFQPILLPSGVVFAVLWIGVIFLWMGRIARARVFITCGVVLYYLLSLKPVSDLFLYPLESPYREDHLDQSSRIHTAVVLTGGSEADVLRGSMILEIYRKWQEDRIAGPKIIVSGNDPLDPRWDEAGKLRTFLTERGVPARDIQIDRESLNTRESSVNLEGWIKRDPFFLVTSAYHMRRSVWSFTQLGMQPVPVAADFRISRRYRWMSLLPSVQGLENCDLAFHEYGGLLFYRWRAFRKN